MNLIKNQSVAAHLDDLRIQHWHFVLICLGIIVTERRVQYSNVLHRCELTLRAC